MNDAPNLVLINPAMGWACPLIPKAASSSLLRRASIDNGVELKHYVRRPYVVPKREFLASTPTIPHPTLFYVLRTEHDRLASYWRRDFDMPSGERSKRALVNDLGLAGCPFEVFFESYARPRLDAIAMPDGENIDEHLRPTSCFIHGFRDDMLAPVALANLDEFFSFNGWGDLEHRNES